MGAPVSLDTRLAGAIRAYRVGRDKPIAMSAGPSGELFRTMGQAHIRARLDDTQHAYYVVIRDFARSAVSAARAGDIASSQECFARAEARARDEALSEETRLLARSWIDQAHAYGASRRRSWQEARDRLASAMQADLVLERDFGYDIFHIGRVHTLHLWLRIDAQAGNRTTAIDLAQAIVDYVAGRRDSLPVGTGWSADRARAITAEFQMAMAARIAGEVGVQLALCARDEARRLFARFPAWQRFEDHDSLGEIYQWGRAKRAFLDGDSAAFLEWATPALEAGRGETTLWYATALDLRRACSALRAAATRPFTDEVAEDAASWRAALPPEMQPPALTSIIVGQADRDPGRDYRHELPSRRFHVFAAGLPRTGTTSLYTLFERFRTGNEFMERETIVRCVERWKGLCPDTALHAFVERRDREGGLEMDAASFNHLYCDFLVDTFPDARFIVTIRAPYDWANSYLKMLMSWHRRFSASGEDPPEWMADYGAMLFGNFSWDWVASAAAVQERARPLADAFVRHWAVANRRVLAVIPEERRLLVRTEHLSQHRDDIARFVGVPPASLSGSIHANAGADRSDVLQAAGRAWVNERAASYGADVLAVLDRVGIEGSVRA